MDEVVKALTEARDLLSKRGAWTQGESASDEDGAACAPSSRLAVCWCPDGALVRVCDRATLGACERALRLSLPRGWDSFVEYNDHPKRRKRDIIKLFDRAIERMSHA